MGNVNRELCPSCDGKGEYCFPEASGVDMSDGWYKCDHCAGTGRVEKAKPQHKTQRSADGDTPSAGMIG